MFFSSSILRGIKKKLTTVVKTWTIDVSSLQLYQLLLQGDVSAPPNYGENYNIFSSQLIFSISKTISIEKNISYFIKYS